MAKSSEDGRYVPVAEAVKRGGKNEPFFQNVRLKVIPRLIAAGKLRGKKVGKVEQVLVDAEFERFMRYGIEPFVNEMQGWSFVAVNAAFDAVAEAVKSIPEASKYSSKVPIGKFAGQSIRPDPKKRDDFLVQPEDSQWPVLVQTAHWFQNVDALLVTVIAARLSAALKTQTVAAWDDDFSGSTAIVCDNGEKSAVVNDEEDWSDFYLYFYENGIALPACFIATAEDGSNPGLVADKPKAFVRADHVVIKVPSESQSGGPHVLEKLGAMAEAIEMELEDESDFRSHSVDQLWIQVQAHLKKSTGKTRSKGK